MKVLLAEDDQFTREGLAEVLRSEGYSVLQAEDGEAAFVFRLDLHDRVAVFLVVKNDRMHGSFDFDGVGKGGTHGNRAKQRGEINVMAMNPALYKPIPVSHIRRPMAIISILLTVIIITVSILLVLIVMAQRPKQEGLGAAFGGSTLDSALGAHTTDILQKITTWLGIIFFVSAIGLSMVKAREYRASAASNVLESVEEREMDLPDFGAELQNLQMPETLDSALLDDAPAPTAPADDAPASAPAADAPASAAPGAGDEAPAAPKEKAKAPAEKGKAGE